MANPLIDYRPPLLLFFGQLFRKQAFTIPAPFHALANTLKNKAFSRPPRGFT